MNNQNNFDLWSSLLLEQHKIFFATANESLKTIFTTNTFDKKNYQNQIEKWLTIFENQFQDFLIKSGTNLNAELKTIFIEATRLLKKNVEQKSITSINELYVTWLSCCQTAYEKNLTSEKYQSQIKAFLQQTMREWEQVQK